MRTLTLILLCFLNSFFTQAQSSPVIPNIPGYAEDIFLGNYPIEFEIYPATDSIVAASLIENGQTTTFQAGTVILLKTGFHAKAGSNFTAKIETGHTPGYILPNNPSFYDYARFYDAARDTTEGGLGAQIYKKSLIWEDRLFPTGNPEVSGAAITQYVKNFNENGLGTCTTANWSCIGPTGKPQGGIPTVGTGQIHVIYFSPQYDQDETVYAATNWGGLWRRVNGSDWELLNTDNQLAFTSVSDIVVDPGNTNLMYITTGDAEFTLGHHAQNPNGTPSLFTPLFTAGVYRSLDGGSNWHSINGVNQALLDDFDNGGTIRKIRMNPDNSNQLFIATTEGVYKTDNASATVPAWAKLTTFQDYELKGLEFKPDDSQTIYTSGLDIYRSTDGGTNWSSMTGSGTGLDLTDLPNEDVAVRINIAVSPANPDKVYAYLITQKIGDNPACYIYVHDGTQWEQKYYRKQSSSSLERNFITPQRSAIAVAPDNEDEVYFGTSLLWGNDDIEVGLFERSPYLTLTYHADVHALAFEPGTNNLYCGTDGGVHIKDRNEQNDESDSFTDISEGLQISTPYGFDDTEGRSDRIIMGNQDTGTNTYQNGEWTIQVGGDGFNGEIDSRTGLAFGSNNSSDRRYPTGHTLFSYDFDTDNLTTREYNPNTPKTQPTDPRENTTTWLRGTFDMENHPQTEKPYFTMSELYERIKEGQATNNDNANSLWKLRSDIGLDVSEQWKRQQLAEVEISNSNPDFMLLALSGTAVDIPEYVPSTSGTFIVEPKLYRTTNGGCDGIADFNSTPCFDDITQNLINSGVENTSYQLLNPPPTGTIIPVITGIAVHPENHLKAWVTFTGYEPTAKVWYTEDGGDTWENADPNQSLNNLPVNDIVYQKGSNDRLYIATDAGIYYKDASMSDWETFCDFPNVRVVELKINYCMGKIRAATFGRSVWEGDLLSSDGTIGEAALLIPEDVTWDYDRGIDKNIRVAAAKKLTIKDATLSMPKDGKIILERGAELVVENATITNNCGEMWAGIEAWGNISTPQVFTANAQSRVRLINATIEHARNAIALTRSGYSGYGGGILYADNSRFFNNKRSVEFIQYIGDNISYFNNCEFKLDDDFRTDGFLGHITMWDVRDVELDDCTFQNLNTTLAERKNAIYTLNAGYNINPECSFSGFQEAIYATNTGSTNEITVEEATFTDNAIGVYASTVNNIAVLNSSFTVGQRRIGALNHGIYINEGTGYLLNNNIFTGVNNVNPNPPQGILCQNTGDMYNVIYGNNFNGFYIANHANGDNRDNSSANLTGLEYLCNLNDNNTYDFAVTKDDNIDDALSGIRVFQGQADEPAGNTFSLNNTPLGSDFFNNSDWPINYYYLSSGFNEEPLNVYQVTKISETEASGCPIIALTSFTPEQEQQLELLYTSNKSVYEESRSAYAARLDDNQTASVISDITSATALTRQTVKARLLALSPWLSEDVVKRILQRTNLFTKADITALLAANPDVLHYPSVRNRLNTILSTEELNTLLETARLQVTERTREERFVRRNMAAFYILTNVLLAHHLSNPAPDSLKVEALLQGKESLVGKYGLTEFFMQKGKFARTLRTVNQIPQDFALTNIQEEAHEDYMRLLNLQIRAFVNDRKLNTLTEQEVQQLVDLANNGRGKARLQAREILNFFYGYRYLPDAPGLDPLQEEPTSLLQPATAGQPKQEIAWETVKAYPNPVSGTVTFQYDLSQYNFSNAVIQVLDINGKLIRTFSLEKTLGDINWDTGEVQPGMYLYKLRVDDTVESVQKLLVVE